MQEDNRLCFSERDSERNWKDPKVLPSDFSNCMFPDGAFHKSGELAVTYLDLKSKEIKILTSQDFDRWKQISSIKPKKELYRPKLSIDHNGDYIVSAHSNHWGNRKNNYIVDLQSNQLKVSIKSLKSPGIIFGL